MAFRRVAELVSRAAQDTGILEALKDDPARLRSILNLTGAQLEALNSASTLPLPPARKTISVATLSKPTLAAAVDAEFQANLPGSGGSLLPPEGSGQLTGGTGFGQPAPQRPPSPSGPGTPPSAPGKPPSGPGTPPPAPGKPPLAPGTPPSAPKSPGSPSTPTAPQTPGVRPPAVPRSPVSPPQAPFVPPTSPSMPAFPQTPMWPPPVYPGPPQAPCPPIVAPCGCSCGCCAMTAVIAQVAITAITAITAIAAMAGKKE
jgi:hypothetical protein